MKKGFTLAEVLITLGIIGIVVAMTIPSLIAKNQEKQTVTILKKNYTNLSQAFMLAINDNGTPDNWGLETQTEEGGKIFIDIISKYLIVNKICTGNTICFASPLFDLSRNITIDTKFNDRAYGILNDGTSFWVYIYSSDCTLNRSNQDKNLQNICAEYVLDTNGRKLPNTYGKDIFFFYITKNNIIPRGTESESSPIKFEEYCNNKNDRINNGISCAAWVIYNENSDYLHCDDLSWNGKTKCK